MEIYARWQKDPLEFIRVMWHLKPQPVKEEFSDIPWRELEAEHFHPFKKGKNITWQQYKALKAIEEGIADEAQRMISVSAGRGVGKTALLSWVILWYLFCYLDSQVPCTAPSADQMYDVLWKELAKWIQKMPKEVQNLYEWQRSYIRMTERPNTWFARARTARKENPEAMVGVHSDHVLAICDEASGVHDVIFQTAEGMLTNENILMIMMSNPRRIVGHFYESHHRLKHHWQTLRFDSRESPVVDKEFVSRMEEKYGEDSDEFRVEVTGQFPREDALDSKGYVPLLVKADLHETTSGELMGTLRLGVDCAGAGDDESVWVIRDSFKAKIALREKVSDPVGIAMQTLDMINFHEINPSYVYIDNFGEGANVAQHLAMMGKNVTPVNVGDMSEEDRFLNKRAEIYWRIKEWLRSGGELVNHAAWEQLLSIRYRRNLKGKFQIMSKHEMRREGFKSPDIPDSLSLTFFDEDVKLLDSSTPIYTPSQFVRLG